MTEQLKMIVEILKDDAQLDLKKGDRYYAVRYQHDDEKITLLSRVSDNYNPLCNQYLNEVLIVKDERE